MEYFISWIHSTFIDPNQFLPTYGFLYIWQEEIQRIQSKLQQEKNQTSKRQNLAFIPTVEIAYL